MSDLIATLNYEVASLQELLKQIQRMSVSHLTKELD